jgi:predicted outer membrane repeat protein
VSAGSIIYLDGTGTSWQRAYTCQPLRKEHEGIYVAKNISFISTGSRVHIACSYGNFWIVDGSGRKGGIQVNFKGLAFRNSSFDFVDTSVNIKDCTFEETKQPALNFSIVELDWFEFILDNVLFQQNVGCMVVKSNRTRKGHIFVNIKDSVFESNGDINIATPWSSILWLNSYNDDINMEMKNVSFEKNSFFENGMIFVHNEHGTTNISLVKVLLFENGYYNLRVPKNLLFFEGYNMAVRIEFCRVISSVGRLLKLAGQSVQMNVFNTEVKHFINFHPGGGVFDIDASHKCNISLISSSFSNGRNPRSMYGGVVSVRAPILTSITIQNSTIQHISIQNNMGYGLGNGGAIYITFVRRVYSNDIVSLNILNSSFLENLSQNGGAIAVIGRVSLTVINCIFMRNKARDHGGSFYLKLNSNSTVNLQNVSFVQNSAGKYGGSIHFSPPLDMVSIVATFKDVNFTRNDAGTAGGAISVRLWSNLGITFKKVRFVENTARYSGSAIALSQPLTSETIGHLVLQKCVFTGNYGYYSAICAQGRYNISCQNSTFSSNHADYLSGGLSLQLKNSILRISNSIFVNNTSWYNSGGAIGIYANNNTNTIITDSIFIKNTAFNGTGGAISILGSTDEIKKKRCYDAFHPRSWNYLNSVEFHRTRFQGNIAKTGDALHITNGLVTLRDCLIIDNFGFASGSQIVTYGSAKIKIYNSVFRETIDKISVYGNEFVFSSFFGIYSNGPLEVYNSTVDQAIPSNEHLIMVSKMGRLEFDNSSVITCPLGYRLIKSDYSYMRNDLDGCTVSVTVIRIFCQQCNSKSYSLQIGQSKGLNVDKDFVCTPCPYGGECFSSIKSKDNFWGYKSGSHPPTLTFTRCPVDYCKSPKPDSDTYNACVGKRTGMMCGTCSRGYTETLLSTHCKLTKDCKHGSFWIAFLALVCLTAFLLIFKPPVITFLVKQVLWFKKLSCRRSANHQYDNVIQALSSEEVRREKGQYSHFVEIIFYFYQISQLFLSPSSSEEYSKTKVIPSLLGYFNFQFSISENTCPFEGLMPHTKKLFKIVPILATMTVIYIIYSFHYLCSRVRRILTPSIAPYLAASVRTLFLSYTVLATVSIQLIRCVSINGEVRWFYNGNVKCYEWWQYAAFVFNAIFVIPFIFILAWAAFKLYHEAITLRQLLIGFILPLPSLLFWLFSKTFSSGISNVEPEEKLNVLKKMLLTPFREPEALYWKSIMIARRFVLVLLFCVITETSYKLFWMTLTCLLALFHHLRVKPFKHNWANNLESISLLCLVVLGFINLYKSVLVEAELLAPTDSFKVIQWLEIIILGLFPASICLLFSFAIISLFVRLLHVCYGSLFGCLSRRGCRDRTQLLDVCENVSYE